MKITTITVKEIVLGFILFVIISGLSYIIYLAFHPPILPKPDKVIIDKIVVAKKIDASVTQAIMDVIKEECFGANVLSIEFMGEESFSLICKIDRKASRRRKK